MRSKKSCVKNERRLKKRSDAEMPKRKPRDRQKSAADWKRRQRGSKQALKCLTET